MFRSAAVPSTRRNCAYRSMLPSRSCASTATAAAARPIPPIPANGTTTTSRSRSRFLSPSISMAPTTPASSSTNNGNVSFGSGFATFTSTGFPVAGFPMVAPFWADVDTREAQSGIVYYRVDANRLIVTWDHVGYFSTHSDKLSTFQLIISDGTDPLVGLGNNVCFCYDDMQWTTGDASGGSGGFGGVPATVGVNHGNGTDFFQIGRFDHEGVDYDGPGGAADGVSYLDNRQFCFNVAVGENIPPVAGGFPPNNTVTVCVGDTYVLNTTFISPEAGQTTTTTVDLMGLANAVAVSNPGNPSTQTLTFTPDLSQVGPHVVR
ncbi:MAG: nidogen-like domain-containing protein, partial [Acidimicrobiia bacterium]